MESGKWGRKDEFTTIEGLNKRLVALYFPKLWINRDAEK